MSANGITDGGTAWMIAGIVLLAVLATLCGAFALLRLAAGASRRIWAARASTSRARRLAPWLRVGLPLATPLADRFGPQLPIAVRRRVLDALRRAELDEELQAQQWIALALLWAGLGLLLAAMLVPDSLVGWAIIGLAFAILPWVWLRDAMRRRDWEILRDLPSYADMLTLALEAGGALSVALRVATARSPDGVLRRAFLRLQNDLRAGRSRLEALRSLGERLDAPGVAPLIAALIQAEANGASLALVLRAQSEQRLNERFARAEKLAMEAPVKLLAPLILCIFPCTFVVLAFPVYVQIVAAGAGP